VEELLERRPSHVEEQKLVAPIPRRGALNIAGVDDMLAKISQCCRPVPGDPIIGFITTGNGVSIHKAECPNLLATDPERWIEVNWSSTEQGIHRTELFLRAEDRKNLLADISARISSDDANIVELNSRTNAENIAEFKVILEITNLQHLQHLKTHLQQMPEMIEVRRR
ncbi:MAG: bifunctional (p)ppGpp synthetase/guanosine-3',5'-bis(diphosphate) 3'-pyrophosphohydrolase, partial [Candidatus Electrothrix sp. AR3]|nr:bifunctional (p)ppGpp synthetase/guanosine-3',5'-bis(diphosphate) 3'-pyrophosphohydrolase [Candidatus Electrothrix sp. AR3]